MDRGEAYCLSISVHLKPTEAAALLIQLGEQWGFEGSRPKQTLQRQPRLPPPRRVLCISAPATHISRDASPDAWKDGTGILLLARSSPFNVMANHNVVGPISFIKVLSLAVGSFFYLLLFQNETSENLGY